MRLPFISALRRREPALERTHEHQDTQALFQALVESIVSVMEEMRLQVSAEEFDAFPTPGQILVHLDAIKILALHNPYRDAILLDASRALATHCNAKAHALRRFHERYSQVDACSEALKTGVQEVIELRKDFETVKATAAPLYRNAHAIYWRIGGIIVLLGVVIAGEAGTVSITWQTLLGDEGLSAQLISVSMAVGALALNEWMVFLGFAPIYKRLANAICSWRDASPALSYTSNTPYSEPIPDAFFAPEPAVSSTATPTPKKSRLPSLASFYPVGRWLAGWLLPISMALLHVRFNFGIIKLRSEFVSEHLEQAFLSNSVGTLTVLALAIHFLLHHLVALYRKARDQRGDAADVKDKGRYVQVAISESKRRERKRRPYEKRAARIERKFQAARKRASHELLRDANVLTTVRIFANALSDRDWSERDWSASSTPAASQVQVTSSSRMSSAPLDLASVATPRATAPDEEFTSTKTPPPPPSPDLAPSFSSHTLPVFTPSDRSEFVTPPSSPFAAHRGESIADSNRNDNANADGKWSDRRDTDAPPPFVAPPSFENVDTPPPGVPIPMVASSRSRPSSASNGRRSQTRGNTQSTPD